MSRPLRRHPVFDSLHPDNLRPLAPAMARIRTSANLRIVAWLLVFAVPVVVLLAAFVPWLQSASATGRVIAYAPEERQQPVEAPISGRVAKWLVSEGDSVVEGQALVEIMDNDPGLVERLAQKRQTAESEVMAATEQIASYSRKLETDQLAKDALSAELDAGIQGYLRKREGEKASYDAAKQNLDRTVTLAEEGIASTRSLEVARRDLAKAQSALAATDREIAAKRQSQNKALANAQGKIESTRAQLESAKSKLATVQRKALELDVKVSRQNSQLVQAPRAGKILRLFGGGGGGQVKAGDNLVTLVPDSQSHAVELWVDGNDMPFVSSGTEARLVFEGWPAMQFVGIHGASQGTFGGTIAFVDATDDGKGKFRVVVVPDESELEWPDRLRQGVRVKGFLMLGQVSLGYEVWRQINGFPPVLDIEKGDSVVPASSKKPKTPTALK